MTADNPATITLSRLAEVTGLSGRRLLQLAVEGMPRAGRGKYSLAQSVQWIVAYWQKRAAPSPLNDARRRLVEAAAGKAELALAALRARLADRGTIDRALAAARARISVRLLAIPSKLAPQVHRTKTMAEVEAAIRTEIVEALEELSGAAPVGGR